MSEVYYDVNGRQFRLGLLPTPEETRKLFQVSSFPTLPESEWEEISRRELFHKLGWYPDQINTSGCTGFSSDMCASKARVLAGQPAIKLSGAYTYSRINGGQDAGSNIGDALGSLMNNGSPSEASCDVHENRNYIYRKNTVQFDEEASRFKLEVGFAVNSVEQAVAAIQRGGILEFALRAGGKFGRLNSEGVSAFVPGGANHAVHADGLKKTNSHGWCLDCQTWTEDFADRSRWLWPIEYLEMTKYQEMWAVFGMIDDPQDSHDPPSPVRIA